VRTLFIAGTHTGIGKTLVTAALAHQLRRAGKTVRALKPVATGFDPAKLADSDTGILMAALGLAPTPDSVDAVSPWRFAAPLSPDMAASREGRRIELDALVGFCRRDGDGIVLIEGIGGLMSPLNDSATVLDWIAALAYPAVLVAGSYLGTLSHTLTAVAAMRARGIAPAAIIASESPESPVALAETIATLRRFLDPVPVIALPRIGAGPRPWERAPDLAAPLANLGVFS